MKATDLDRRFDDGEDVSADLDWTGARRPNLESARVVVDLPAHLVADLDRQAERLGTTRQALIETWIAERLDASA